MRRPSGGLFISCDGIDGGGKSTQCRMLAGALARLGHDAIVTPEPGWEGFGKDVHDLFYRYDGVLTVEARLCLMLAQRNVHIAQVIKPALEAGNIVICDRFRDSTEVFQLAVPHRDDLIGLHAFMERLMVGQFMPDLTFVIDVPIEVARERMDRRGNLTVFDRKPPEFHRKVRAAFREIAERRSDRCRLINGNAEPAEVHAEMLSHVLKALQGLASVRDGTVS